ncbi:MAG: hypothetical protein J0L91_11085 [Burkholderiales bacterium]|nr:hypothetical protein [Burkholderiales bacterium]
MSANLDRLATFTRELAEFAARTLREELGLPEDQAIDLGVKIAHGGCQEFKGEIIYVPKDKMAAIDARDLDMLAAYIAAGRDIVPVAKQFDVCVQTAYRRIRLAEAAAYAQRQGALFDGGP